MGNFAGSLGGYFTLHTDVWEVATNAGANQSTVRCHTYITCSSTGTGIYNLGGTGRWDANVNGNTNGGNFSYDFRGNNNTLDLNSYDTVVGHDANGYATIGWSGSSNLDDSPYATTANTSGSLGLTRLGSPPVFLGITSDTIKPTSARLGAELTSVGRGTSANLEMFYRLPGGGSTSLGIQADAAGYNYWNVSGLQPGKTYEYYCNCTNNNGDFAQSSVSTFKTQPVSGMIAVMNAVI